MGDLAGRRRSLMASLLAATVALATCSSDDAPLSGSAKNPASFVPALSLPEPVRGDGMITDLATIVMTATAVGGR